MTEDQKHNLRHAAVIAANAIISILVALHILAPACQVVATP